MWVKLLWVRDATPSQLWKTDVQCINKVTQSTQAQYTVVFVEHMLAAMPIHYWSIYLSIYMYDIQGVTQAVWWPSTAGKIWQNTVVHQPYTSYGRYTSNCWLGWQMVLIWQYCPYSLDSWQSTALVTNRHRKPKDDHIRYEGMERSEGF